VCGIVDLLSRGPRTLSHGNQRRVEMARALAADPTLMLLDEPTAGMTERESDEIRELILRLREAGITVVLIEHDMRVAMNVSDWIVVLDYGAKLAAGTRDTARSDPRVIEASMGMGE